jgi:hypothetical protein
MAKENGFFKENSGCLIVGCVLFLVLLCGCCGTGTLLYGMSELLDSTEVTEDYDISNVEEVYLEGPMNLNLEESTENSLEVQAASSSIEYIDVDEEGGILYIGYNPDFWMVFNPSITINAELSNVKKITLEGAGTVDYQEIDQKELSVNIIGAGSVDLGGNVKDLDLSIEGAGSVSALELEADEAEVVISGAGSVELSVAQKLKGTINGSGSISYATDNDELEVEKEVNGLGTIQKKGE